MKYKYELHCHTSPVSFCGKLTAKELVDLYISHGYTGIVLTNHINQQTFMKQPTSRWKDLMEYYLSDYKKVLHAADGKLDVLLGAELRFNENFNDYLLYGIDEAFLLKHTHMMHMGIHKFSEIARESGILLFQAHPFRNGMTINRPELLDGIEVYNGHPRHESRNELAALWRDKYNLLASAGSDTHLPEDIGGGILTDVRIQDSKALVEVLKSGNFEIMKRENA